MTFEELLCLHRSAIERYVYYKIPHQEDAEEIMQEALLAAFQSFASLSEES